MLKMARYRCPDCLSLFLTEPSRNDHIRRVHIQHEVEHRCPTCSGLFKSAINLRKHFERYHPNTAISAKIMSIEDHDDVDDDESIENMSKCLYFFHFK